MVQLRKSNPRVLIGKSCSGPQVERACEGRVLTQSVNLHFSEQDFAKRIRSIKCDPCSLNSL